MSEGPMDDKPAGYEHDDPEKYGSLEGDGTTVEEGEDSAAEE